jgi:tetratricopeptide (TPR) repeat protein
MGNEAIVSDRHQVRLADEVSTDVQQFRAALDEIDQHDHAGADVCPECVPVLLKSVRLYRGDFMAGFSLRDAPEFDDWMRTTAEMYRLASGRANESLAIAQASLGDYHGAIESVNMWLDLDPLREPGYRQLMMLYGWQGDRSGATDAYRRCVATLDRELGVEPLEETTELYEAILDDDLPPAPGVRRRISAKPSPGTPIPPGLIDREDALRALLRAADVEHGGQVFRVTGEAWMGKTRLLEELLKTARATRPTVLFARGFRAERQIPYGLITQLLTGLVGDNHWEKGRENVPDWALNEAARLYPDLGEPTSVVPGDVFGETRLHDALLRIFLATSALTVVDDAQWGDTSSIKFLTYLANRIVGSDSLLVVAHRPDETSGLADFVGTTQPPIHAVIELEPLTPGQVSGLAESPDRLITLTGGIPALVAEALIDETALSHGVKRFMDVRLSEFDGLSRQILGSVAVLSGTCDIDLLRETSGRAEEEVVDVAELLVARGILRVDSNGHLGFALDSMENLIYEETNLIRRRLLHRRAAAALEGQPGREADPRLATVIAQHHRHAGQDGLAANWYQRAGDLSRQVFAQAEAIDSYQIALALGHPEVAPIHIAIGDALLLEGRISEALAEFEKAAARGQRADSAIAEHRIGEAHRRLGRLDAALAHFEKAAGEHPDPASLLCDWSLALHRWGNPQQALAKAEMAVEKSVQGSSSNSRAFAVLGIVNPDQEKGRIALEHALELAGADPVLRMAALNALGHAFADAGEEGAAVTAIDEALAIANDIGDRHREAALYSHLADLRYRSGKQKEAEALQTEAVKLFVGVEPGSWEPEVWLLSRW